MYAAPVANESDLRHVFVSSQEEELCMYVCMIPGSTYIVRVSMPQRGTTTLLMYGLSVVTLFLETAV